MEEKCRELGEAAFDRCIEILEKDEFSEFDLTALRSLSLIAINCKGFIVLGRPESFKSRLRFKNIEEKCEKVSVMALTKSVDILKKAVLTENDLSTLDLLKDIGLTCKGFLGDS